MNHAADTARSIYDAAHEHFDAPPLRFWERYGTRTVDRLHLTPGARVLDVCSGTGGSALAAASRGASVVAVDISGALLRLAEDKARAAGLSNIQFRVDDMTKLGGGAFDATVIVFGLFFAPDMVEQLRILARTVRPGGKLAVTVWGPRLFEPLYSALSAACNCAEAEYRPWSRITTASGLRDLFARANLHDVDLVEEAGTCPLAAPEDFWTIVLGTGLRSLVDGRAPSAVARIRTECLMRARDVRAVETNVIYAIANI